MNVQPEPDNFDDDRDDGEDISQPEAMRQAIAAYDTKDRGYTSPHKHDPIEHGQELSTMVRQLAARDDAYPLKAISELLESDLIDLVVRCSEVLAARRVAECVRNGMGLAAFVAHGERVPVKKDLRLRMEAAFLTIADALVAVNRGDLDYLEMGQSETAEVTRTRQLREEVADGKIDMDHAMTRLAACFDGIIPTQLVEPWDPLKLADWSTCYASTTQKLIATFLLNLWNDAGSDGDYPWPRFEFFDAMRRLDGRSLNVIRAWMCSHWLP